MLDRALKLAAAGFHIFPIAPGKKSPPLIQDFPANATREDWTIREWWEKWPDANIGISTSRYGDDGAVIVVDVDVKSGKDGNGTLLRLELEGNDLPATLTCTTPTGGRHLFYSASQPVRQGVDVLGPGVDIRSHGGYVVGAGSTTELGEYAIDDRPIVPAPQWLIDALGAPRKRAEGTGQKAEGIDPEAARKRVVDYLTNEAPLAVEGEGGDHTTFVVAARCKDLGADEDECFYAMDLHWNERCSPPWPHEELSAKIRNAYRYGTEPQGAAAPEVQFPPVEQPKDKPAAADPVLAYNKDFAYVTTGGGDHVLWETTDETGQFTVKHLDIHAFHRRHAARKITYGKKTEETSKLWMAHPQRRSYDGLVFDPAGQHDPRFYNLWRGFSVQPFDAFTGREHEPVLNMFLDHALVNVCGNDKDLFHWLMGYFAHLIQKPQEKPLVALVFHGSKGVGKNVLVETVGNLLGGHFLVASDKRYLCGNFNGHMERLLFLVLDEAFWSGDKGAEGILKSLITSRKHLIEHKGKEPYAVANRLRVAIVGNEDWLVPASSDERRYAVFHVGDGRKQDRAFFTRMREGMESGGYRLLLRYLLDYPLAGVDVNAAPVTKALVDQKHESLDPWGQWWLDCLTEGTLLGSDFPPEWDGGVIEKDKFRAAYNKYLRDRKITSRALSARAFGRSLLKVCPSMGSTQQRTSTGFIQVYKFPPLDQARKEWEKVHGGAVDWAGC